MSDASKVFILTGASRGIGLAIAHYLLQQSHKLVVLARSEAPLLKLQQEYPQDKQVTVLAGDLCELSIAAKAVALALQQHSRVDGLILNHGALDPVRRISDCSAEEWRKAYDINFFSYLALAQAAIPALRTSKGRIVMVSSGAATGAYPTWGAYGSAKAAVNHLAMTLAVEEPSVTTVSIRPGVVDTEMQREIREVHHEFMDDKDRLKFAELKTSGALLKPEQPGHVIAKLIVSAPSALSGKFLNWNAEELSEFQ